MDIVTELRELGLSANTTIEEALMLGRAAREIKRLRTIEAEWKSLGADNPGALKLLLELAIQRHADIQQQLDEARGVNHD